MIPSTFYKFLFVCVLFIFIIHCSDLFDDAKKQQAFKNWINDYKSYTHDNLGIPNELLNKIFKNVKYNETVLYHDNNQIEFTFTKDEYLAKVASPLVLNNGKTFLKENKQLLDDTEQKYKIPTSLMVAFLGVESYYGTFTGNFNAAEALATLAFDSDRKQFFTSELNSLMTLMNNGSVKYNDTSSWAGALGALQFLPSIYLAYGISGPTNPNNKINLYSNYADIFASEANYLRGLGWNYYKNWGYEVLLPNNFNQSLAAAKVNKTIYAWENLGVKRLNNTPFPNIASNARLIITENKRAFLVTSNFNVIMTWNRSEAFALAVGVISDELNEYNNTLNAAKKPIIKSHKKANPSRSRKRHGNKRATKPAKPAVVTPMCTCTSNTATVKQPQPKVTNNSSTSKSINNTLPDSNRNSIKQQVTKQNNIKTENKDWSFEDLHQTMQNEGIK